MLLDEEFEKLEVESFLESVTTSEETRQALRELNDTNTTWGVFNSAEEASEAIREFFASEEEQN